MAQSDPENISQQRNDTNREAEEVEESIVKKELQISILRKLIEEIGEQDSPTNPTDANAGFKDKKLNLDGQS